MLLPIVVLLHAQGYAAFPVHLLARLHTISDPPFRQVPRCSDRCRDVFQYVADFVLLNQSCLLLPNVVLFCLHRVIAAFPVHTILHMLHISDHQHTRIASQTSSIMWLIRICAIKLSAGFCQLLCCDCLHGLLQHFQCTNLHMLHDNYDHAINFRQVHRRIPVCR
jgi:hypothetical protein